MTRCVFTGRQLFSQFPVFMPQLTGCWQQLHICLQICKWYHYSHLTLRESTLISQNVKQNRLSLVYYAKGIEH